MGFFDICGREKMPLRQIFLASHGASVGKPSTLDLDALLTEI
jgi:hypothetical protein